MFKNVDLHTHSTFSDGSDSPTELVDKAKLIGLSAIALTDHDTVNGLSEFNVAGKANGIEVIDGIELSTYFDNVSVHIVGLFIDKDSDILNSTLENLRKTRIERNLKIIERFKERNIIIDYDEMLELYPVSVLTRAHFADYLVGKGFAKTRNEIFERYIGDGKPCYVDREKFSSNDAIELIHKAGGLAVFAHPMLCKVGQETLDLMVRSMSEAGLDAIEGLYSTYNTSNEKEVAKLANRYGLLLSGGSDYHGRNKPDIHLGCGRGRLNVPYEIYSKLLEYHTSSRLKGSI